jgi:hypothetical protein
MLGQSTKRRESDRHIATINARSSNKKSSTVDSDWHVSNSNGATLPEVSTPIPVKKASGASFALAATTWIATKDGISGIKSRHTTT